MSKIAVKLVAKNGEYFIVMPVKGGFSVFPIEVHTSYIHKTEELALYALTHYFDTKELNAFFS